MATSSNQPTSKQDYTLVNTEDPELSLADLIKEQLHHIDPISTVYHIYRASCICRVPPTLREVNEESYTPQVVIIGPFHQPKGELTRDQENKLRYLKAFLDRTQKSLEDCIEWVKDWEERARNVYNERIDLSSNEFVKMMLVDSCFIIEAMLRALFHRHEPTDYLSDPENIPIVQRDMILLENQIPFFVLSGVFQLGFSESASEDKFIELLIKYFSDHLLLTVTEEGDVERIFKNVMRHQESGFKIEHLTDLLWICHLPTILRMPNMDYFVPTPTAARLHEAGMKFKTGTSKCLLDIQYNTTGLLKIPKFKVQDNTECLLKNLIALETVHFYPFRSYIIDYVYFMDKFIDTATDVDLLIQNGIIVNALSDSAAVASLFKNLAMNFKNLAMKTMLSDPYYFTSISEDIKAYCNVPWHRRWHTWKATFKRDYCSTPWKIASTAAAIILLVLTLIQTICSIISLF